MTPDLFWIPGPWVGRLAIITRPRGGEWLPDEVSGWRRAGLNVVVSLLETDEASKLDLNEEADIARANGVGYISFPIPDRGVPSSLPSAVSLIARITHELEGGNNVAVHCRQGVGRSGLIAAGVLINARTSPPRAIEAVSSARREETPETPEQSEWLRRLHAELSLVMR